VRADSPRRVAVAQVQASPEQLGHPPRETDGPPQSGQRSGKGAS
jgi:hypothetical protein